MNTGSIIAGDRAWDRGSLRAGRGDAGSARASWSCSRKGWAAGAADRGAAVVDRILPSRFQGVKLNSIGTPGAVHQEPDGVSGQSRRARSIPSTALNHAQYAALKDSEILTRVAQ